MARKKQVKKIGPGKKTCPSCKTIVGARTQSCKCGHAFIPKRSRPKAPLDCSLEELEALLESKRKLAKPLSQLIEQYGGAVVLAEVKRLAR